MRVKIKIKKNIFYLNLKLKRKFNLTKGSKKIKTIKKIMIKIKIKNKNNFFIEW
jgi:hypothetical protein